jgi:hypothetical protein
MRHSTSGAILVLFARPAVPGEVKSRLAASLGEALALDLYLAFLRDSIELLHRVSPRGIRPAIAWAAPVPGSGAALGDGLGGVEVLVQEGEDLGQRMSNCIAELLSRGHDRVVLIGADTPSLPLETLYLAFDKLRDRDLVLGPSRDGGYYLLGARSVVPEIFRGIPWGTDRVLVETLRILKILGMAPFLLPAWSDVDTIEDLERLRDVLAGLPESDPTARHTRSVLARLPAPSV